MKKESYSKQDIIDLLKIDEAQEIERVRTTAEQILLEECLDWVYFRGLIEFSNYCAYNCDYCGIRRDNRAVQRYQLSSGSIVEAAQFAAQMGYGSLVLQSGQRSDEEFVAYVEHAVKEIKRVTRTSEQPHGLGITLCVGEQSADVYRRFFAAGAHRYLLRIETSDPALFKRIHPDNSDYEQRVNCLEILKNTGFQVGTGVMIGIPGQTIEMLADDILFFKKMDVDMIGMGPYIPHDQTPLGRSAQIKFGPERVALSLRMIAVARLVLRDVNIAATTALQALDSTGREKALRYGANIIMPQLTPTSVRKQYLLYRNKPCVEEAKEDCCRCLKRRVESAQRRVGYYQWGDAPHALKRKATPLHASVSPSGNNQKST